MAGVPERRRRVLSVRHRRHVGRRLCLCLLGGHRRGTLDRTAARASTHILSPTKKKSTPVSPGKHDVVVTNIVGKVTLPTVILLLFLFFSAHVHGHGSVRSTMAIPFLNRVPGSSSGKGARGGRATRNVTIHTRKHSVMSRTFHVVHAGVSFVHIGSGGVRIIAFDSFKPNTNGACMSDGLTTDFTRASGGIVLVSVSVHGKALASRAHLRAGRGKVASFLTNGTAASRVVGRGRVYRGLSFVPTNPVTPGPSRLLLDRRLRMLVARLHGHCSCVFISGIPMKIITSTTVAGHVTSLAVFIMQINGLSHHVLPRIRGVCHDKRLGGVSLMLGKTVMGANKCKNCKCNCNCNCNCISNSRSY